MPNANKLTNSELTALHTETMTALRAAAQKSRTLANISRRAASLLADGYSIEGFAGTHYYEVTSPAGTRYKVWHGVAVGFECNCPCFTEHNTCKHLEAVDLMKRDEAQAAEFDAQDAYDPFAYRF